MIKAVVFDIDNTLYSYDNAHAVAWEALCAYAKEQLDMDAERFLQCHKAAQTIVKERLNGDCAALHNRQLRYQVLLEENNCPLHHAIAMNDLYWSTLIGAARPEPGILDCLKSLKQAGFTLGIGTDMTIDYQLKKLATMGMLPLFDFIVSSEEVNTEKPNKKLFALCAEKAKARPEECLFIGDSIKKDYQGALCAGMHPLWYCPDAGKAEEHPEIRRLSHYDRLMEMLVGG